MPKVEERTPLASSPESKGFLTFAYGRDDYIDLALALGRSLRRFDPEIHRAIVTDRLDGTFDSIFQHVIPMDPNRGEDVVQKLYLDLYTPFRATLFIDCDSLVFHSLAFVFDRLSGGPTIIPDALYFHDRDHPKHGVDFDILQKRAGIRSLPGFNGGAYYVETGTRSSRIFARAREILPEFRDYGIDRFRSGPNDESLLGMAMAEIGHQTVAMPRQVMRETFGLEGEPSLDILRGKAALRCYDINFEPCLVHFCTGWQDLASYRNERRKLELLDSPVPLLAWGYDCWLRLRSVIRTAWEFIPRPLRLLFHAFRTRLKRIVRHG